MKHNVPVQSLIDHIKTATDVDPWAKEMAEELLKEQEAVEPITEHHLFLCPACKNTLFREQKYCHECGKRIEWEGR